MKLSILRLSPGGDGKELSEGVLGESLGGEMSASSVSLTGDMSSPPTTSSCTLMSPMPVMICSAADCGGGPGGVMGGRGGV